MGVCHAFLLCLCRTDDSRQPLLPLQATRLHASQITFTGHFEVPLGATAAERAVRGVGEQIDAKRAADTIRSQFTPVWDLAVWRYLPADPVRSLNSRVASDDDPFLTPEYLKVSARQLDYQLKVSEQAARDFFH